MMHMYMLTCNSAVLTYSTATTMTGKFPIYMFCQRNPAHKNHEIWKYKYSFGETKNTLTTYINYSTQWMVGNLRSPNIGDPRDCTTTEFLLRDQLTMPG